MHVTLTVWQTLSCEAFKALYLSLKPSKLKTQVSPAATCVKTCLTSNACVEWQSHLSLLVPRPVYLRFDCGFMDVASI